MAPKELFENRNEAEKLPEEDIEKIFKKKFLVYKTKYVKQFGDEIKNYPKIVSALRKTTLNQEAEDFLKEKGM